MNCISWNINFFSKISQFSNFWYKIPAFCKRLSQKKTWTYHSSVSLLRIVQVFWLNKLSSSVGYFCKSKQLFSTVRNSFVHKPEGDYFLAPTLWFVQMEYEIFPVPCIFCTALIPGGLDFFVPKFDFDLPKFLTIF